MKLLLDTCCWLWWLSDTDKLSKQQLEAITLRATRLRQGRSRRLS